MVIILAMTGIAVLLLLLETAVPYLRGSITLERDVETLSGETVRNTVNLAVATVTKMP